MGDGFVARWTGVEPAATIRSPTTRASLFVLPGKLSVPGISMGGVFPSISFEVSRRLHQIPAAPGTLRRFTDLS